MKHLFLTILLGSLSLPLLAEEVSVAVAANFTAPMKLITAKFEATTGHRTVLSVGSSGKFYAQISNGAPFELFFSADQTIPLKLEQDGLADSASRFTYALGALTLWSADPRRIDNSPAILRQYDYNKLAVANPRLAPYGAAAMEVLTSLGLVDSVKDRIVWGENIAQTYQFAHSGNADLGFVALSQVWRNGEISVGSAWIVPDNLYNPIRQDAVLLLKGENNPAATALLQFMKSEMARTIIKEFGYGTGDE